MLLSRRLLPQIVAGGIIGGKRERQGMGMKSWFVGGDWVLRVIERYDKRRHHFWRLTFSIPSVPDVLGQMVVIACDANGETLGAS